MSIEIFAFAMNLCMQNGQSLLYGCTCFILCNFGIWQLFVNLKQFSQTENNDHLVYVKICIEIFAFAMNLCLQNEKNDIIWLHIFFSCTISE